MVSKHCSRQLVRLKHCLLMNDTTNRCVVTQRLMPTHSALLRFRKTVNLEPEDKETSQNEFFFAPNFSAEVIGHNVFIDPKTNARYGLSEVTHCFAN